MEEERDQRDIENWILCEVWEFGFNVFFMGCKEVVRVDVYFKEIIWMIIMQRVD